MTLQLESTESIEYRIRMKGTYTLSIVNMTDNLADPSNKYYTMPKTLHPLSFSRRLRHKSRAIDDDIMKLNLFLNDKIELPFNCKF